MFNFEGASREKGARCGLPMKSAALAQAGEQWPLLGQDPSKKIRREAIPFLVPDRGTYPHLGPSTVELCCDV